MKHFLAILTALLTFAVTPAKGQLRLGVKGGLNVSQLKLNEGLFEGNNRVGFFVGPTLDIGLPLKLLTVDVSVLYDNYQVSMRQDENEISETLQYVDIPVNVSLGFGWEALCKIYISTGPQLAFNIGKVHVLEANYSLDNTMLSWNFGIGATILKNYRVGYNYNLGIGYTAELTNRHNGTVNMSERLYNPTHKVCLTYFF